MTEEEKEDYLYEYVEEFAKALANLGKKQLPWVSPYFLISFFPKSSLTSPSTLPSIFPSHKNSHKQVENSRV